MNLGTALREARDAGYNVAWYLGLWDRKPPEPLTDEFIARMENNSSSVADWELKENTVIAVRRSDGRRMEVYRVI